MNKEQITAVAKVLAQWNPLGNEAKKVADLDGYRIEATDIIFGLEVWGNSVKPEQIVMEVLSQAFHLDLGIESCIMPGREIAAILEKSE